MKKPDKKLWSGLTDKSRALLRTREYESAPLSERLAGSGVEAAELTAADRNNSALRKAWIPGVEIFKRTVYPQRHRGFFGEFARRDEGIFKEIGLWPAQWATARMFAGTAKGFHIHPPSVPSGRDAAEWFRHLYGSAKGHYSERPYDKEQWDVIFFVQGRVEVLLRDTRAGMESGIMHFFVEGDNHRGSNNVGMVIPAGVAHAFRVEGSEDAIMVYGTSTSFQPEFEGRIASDVETAELPQSWVKFLRSGR